MGSKKSSNEIHNNHAKQKARRDRERKGTGRRAGGVHGSHSQANPLSNPFAQMLAGLIRLNRAKAISKAKGKREYKPRKV